MVDIRDLSKAYGKKQVLHNVGLSFAPGKVYGIVGENGAGKTTLFRCIAGLEQYSGDINSDFSILKNHLGFLQTNPVMLSRITGTEYLRLHCVARGLDQTDFTTQNIFELPLDEYAENYSTGMKKKLAFLGILLQKNDVFILDEPFNGVDIHSNMLITAIIRALRDKGKTIIISSHIFSTLSDTADEIHVLREGRIAKSVLRPDFAQLDREMQDFVIGDKLERVL